MSDQYYYVVTVNNQAFMSRTFNPSSDKFMLLDLDPTYFSEVTENTELLVPVSSISYVKVFDSKDEMLLHAERNNQLAQQHAQEQKELLERQKELTEEARKAMKGMSDGDEWKYDDE
jgi:hypothetical protein